MFYVYIVLPLSKLHIQKIKNFIRRIIIPVVQDLHWTVDTYMSIEEITQ